MPRPPRPLAEVTATRLVAAAAAAFAQGGLDGASLNGILKQVGMGKGSFYHHFADKAALHDWVTEALSRQLVDALDPPKLSTLTVDTFRPHLSELVDRFSRVAASSPALMDLGRMFHNSVDATPERTIYRVRHTLIAWLGEALQRGQLLGVIRDDLPLTLLSAWTIASLTAIDEWVLTDPHPLSERNVAARAALESLWQMLSPLERPAEPWDSRKE